nr:Na+/H+ antiporter subunit E [Kibdelosporangium sp. MJ126-NF4]CEL17519.1 Cation antiporter precursor [Kibdelosporangium sp. MJ126-NF4]CTQ91254.1 Cation antiporter precursor [Kibdelosporangium sp. MJ126-NF4]
MRWFSHTMPILALFWLLLSGHYTPLFLVLGVVSVALVGWISWRAGLGGPNAVTWAASARLPLYLLWLGKEILVSSFSLARTVWAWRPVVRPVVATMPTQEMTAVSQVVYANSITLTPGTLTMDVGDQEIEVHGLSTETIKALHTGDMRERVRRLETRE